MASLKIDDICDECLKGDHCGGINEWCHCCGSDEEIVEIKKKVKKKPKRDEWL